MYPSMIIQCKQDFANFSLEVLLTEDKRLVGILKSYILQRVPNECQIEFPSILLPEDITSGSIVDVNVSRNFEAETKSAKSFAALQSSILSTFGSEEPCTPTLRCRNATQTSVVLDWDPINLATADLRSLTLYRNGSKAGAIPKPFENTSTKISGLAVDTVYTFALVLRTSAGTYSSDKLVVRTHKMTDLSGITITSGIMADELKDSLERTVESMGAKMIDNVRIDTTHFVCTEGRGSAWEKAVEMNVPVVLPDWVKGCEREGRIVGVRGYYLNADPKLRQIGPTAGISREESTTSILSQQQETPRTEVTPPTPERSKAKPPGAEDDGSEEEEEERRVQKSSAPVQGTNSQGASPTMNKSDDETSGTSEASGDEQPERAERNMRAEASEGESEAASPDLGKMPTTPGQTFDEVEL